MQRKLVLYDEQTGREIILPRVGIFIVGRGEKEDSISGLFWALTKECLEGLDPAVKKEYLRSYDIISRTHLAIIQPEHLDTSIGTTMTYPFPLARLVDMSRHGTRVLNPLDEDYVPVIKYNKNEYLSLKTHPATNVYENAVIGIPKYFFRLTHRDE